MEAFNAKLCSSPDGHMHVTDCRVRTRQIRELLKMPLKTKTKASITAPAAVRPAPAASVRPG